MRKHFLALMTGAVLWTAPAPAAREQPAQWIVVAAPAFRPALEPLIERRRAQGLKVVVLDNQPGGGAALRTRLGDLCSQFHGLNLILLAGIPFATNPLDASQTVVPALLGTTGRMSGQAGGDYAYSLPNTNGRPTVAVGRFPATNAQQARDMVRKTLNLEDDTRPGAWRNRLFLFMGDPNGGPLGDMMVEPALNANLAQIDPSWTVRAESATASRFQMPAALLRESALHSLEEGELFSIFLLHSSPPAMWLTGNHWISRDDLARAQIPRGAGVFFTSGCYACQWRGAGGKGFGLAAIRNPAGPVAVMGATRESYAVAGLLALEGLMKPLGKPPFPSLLGQYWLAVQAGLAEAPLDDVTFTVLDIIDGSKGKIPLSVLRREHLEMWLLFGDPGLRLPIPPLDVSLQTPRSVEAGQPMTIQGTLPDRLSGENVQVTLERPLSTEPAAVDKASAPSAEQCARANNFILASAEATGVGTHFTCMLMPPSKLSWSNVVLRATAATTNECALGVLTLPVGRHE